MTIGPDLELQGAIVAKLRANAALKLLIGTTPRIYEQPPQGAWPGSYITVGESQELDDSAERLNASEVYPKIHVWSRDAGYADVKKIAATVKNALHNADLSLTENTFVLIEWDRTDTGAVTDGVTKHLVLTFRALTDNA